ncbi:hypothetical protein GIB67_042556 [Kingdonia uniflora]|uniref:FAS1 domain-containing protein n=1 Tax=Kingdonia uniflora TaxID=39325 RepID=A0A7J7M169_9MAGN|nr:hypothetical protein GIB67_042556 [Kingdonia uniflora]
MAIYLTTILLMGVILSVTAVEVPSDTNDVTVAIEEMQTANYFSFVMLLNMYPPERIHENITFLMPNDRMLSQISMQESSVHEFLLRHSIPSPLLFDHLKLFPSGSLIPSSNPNFMLRVLNNGRRDFHLNNVQIISPNICTAGSSIRCHGIKGVLMTTTDEQNTTLSSSCYPASRQSADGPTSTQGAAGPASSSRASRPPNPSPPIDPLNRIPATTTPPVNFKKGSKKSGSSHLLARRLVHSIITCMIILPVLFQV